MEKLCKEADKQGVQDENTGAIARTYYAGTQEEVIIGIDFPPGHGGKPNYDDCVKELMRLVDDCNLPDPKENPSNLKAGGYSTVSAFTYRIEPKKKRHDHMETFVGGCHCKYVVFENQCEVWGHGWASNDHGQGIKDNLRNCALLRWDFKYGLGSDSREWTAKIATGVFQKRCTKNALRTAGGPKDLECTGKG